MRLLKSNLIFFKTLLFFLFDSLALWKVSTKQKNKFEIVLLVRQDAIGDFVTSTTNYENFTCCGSVSYKNIFACQFHPEKSADYGLSIFDCLKVEIEKESN